MSNPEQIPGLTDREILEGMTADQIFDNILANGEKVSEIERHMNLASDVLEGVYGLTISEILQKREENGEAKTVSP